MQIDLKNTVLKIQDGTSVTPLDLEVKIGDGTLNWSTKRNIEYKPNRGKVDTASGGSVREGDEVPCEVSFQFVYEFVVSSTGGDVTPYEALTQTGEATDWVSVGSECEPYSVTLVFENNVSCGTVEDETLTFTDFRYEDIGGDPKGGMISVSGRCKIVKPVIARAAIV
jgi:hypothetical protein